VPLAGLEPAACCLGDVPAWTLCWSLDLLVSGDREAKVIRSSRGGAGWIAPELIDVVAEGCAATGQVLFTSPDGPAASPSLARLGRAIIAA
jgi:hypothetical protein